MIKWNTKYDFQIENFTPGKWFNHEDCAKIRVQIIEMKIKMSKFYHKVMEDHEKIKIEKALLRCNMDLNENLKHFLNSILSRFKDCITFDKLITEDEDNSLNIVTNPSEIETIVIDHYQNYASKHNVNSNKSNLKESDIELIEHLYIPKGHIKSSWYDDLMNRFTIEELKATINSLPKNKALGVSQLPYEAYKHASNELLDLLLFQFNHILQMASIPDSWKLSTIFFIPKKAG